MCDKMKQKQNWGVWTFYSVHLKWWIKRVNRFGETNSTAHILNILPNFNTKEIESVALSAHYLFTNHC